MHTTTSVILDTRRMKKDGTYPLKLQVTHQRKTKHFPSIFNLSEVDYQKLTAPRISAKLQRVRDGVRRIQREAEDFLEGVEAFSFYLFQRDFVQHHDLLKSRKLAEEAEDFEEDDVDVRLYNRRFPLLKEKNLPAQSIGAVYLRCIKNLLREERIGTALAYKDSYNSILQFRGNLLFAEVTVSVLHQYEQWMLKKGRSRTTIGIKLRNLRAVFNEAIAQGLLKKEKCYPFGRRKYQIPTGKKVKKALDQEVIGRLYYSEPSSPLLQKAKDFWLFCYFGNGMNPKDVVYLKWKNMQGEYFVFTRAKTERSTRTDPRPITVYITEDMQNIIERHGTKDKHPESYVFPIMRDDLNPLKQYERVPVFTRFINDGMKAICEELGIDKNITTIVSRHTFSTQLKRSGVSTEFIQEALGHTDKRTTENYLDSFENEVKKQYAQNLVAFKKMVVQPRE
ncbi:site-specific integrase [Flavisolibacter nicotianae]|uniref:site-specific integrase n=1 Tax=Flavisolibacter nicotianae TaxID=2364882 RepID=UPI0013C45A02|nr:site-specific integrase [Flavisolibacter nicotianae]